MTTLLFFFGFLLPVFIAVITNPETLAITIAGVVAPILIEVLKRFTDIKGRTAFVVTIIASFAIAVITLAVTGQINSLSDIYKSGLMVIALATTIYKFLLADKPAAQSEEREKS